MTRFLMLAIFVMGFSTQALAEKKELHAILRNTGSGWYAIDDANHDPLNVGTVTSDSTKISVGFADAPIDRIYTFQCTMDEAYAPDYLCGLSVGMSVAEVYIYSRSTGASVDPATLTNAAGNIWLTGWYLKDGEGEEPPTNTETAFTAGITTTTWGGASNITIRQTYDLAALTVPSLTVAKVRVKIKASASEGIEVNPIYIGQQASSGDAWDFNGATKVQITNGGPSISASTGATQWSDWVPFTWDKTSKLVVSYYVPNNTATDMVAKAANANVNSWYKYGNDAATDNATGYTSAGSGAPLIEEIEFGD